MGLQAVRARSSISMRSVAGSSMRQAPCGMVRGILQFCRPAGGIDGLHHFIQAGLDLPRRALLEAKHKLVRVYPGRDLAWLKVLLQRLANILQNLFPARTPRLSLISLKPFTSKKQACRKKAACRPPAF